MGVARPEPTVQSGLQASRRRNEGLDDIRVDDYSSPSVTDLAVDWLDFAVVWLDSRTYSSTAGYGETVASARVDAFGNKIGMDLQSSTTPEHQWDPAATVTGNGFGVTWVTNIDDAVSFLAFQEFGLDGTNVGPFSYIDNNYDHYATFAPDVKWNGVGLGFAWSKTVIAGGSDYGIYFRSLDLAGNGPGRTLIAETGPSRPPSLAWSGLIRPFESPAGTTNYAGRALTHPGTASWTH